MEVTYPVLNDSLVTGIKSEVKGKLNIAEIIKIQGNRLRRYIRNRVNSKEDAEDIFQEVLYRLAEADQLMKPIDQISGWLYAVARNRITDLYRKSKPGSIPAHLTGTDDEGLVDELDALIFENGDSPETDYLRSLVWTELDIALKELPDEQRFVFEMTEMKGKSFKEISRLTGVPVNTLISRKRYAILYLRERLLLLYNELLIF